MSYILELSINHKKVSNTTEYQLKIIDVATKYNCVYYYNKYEFSGKNRTIQYNNNIFTFTFPDNQELLCGFIKEIKTYKGIYIENIGFDNIIYKLIYASKKYLNIMEKENVNKYLEKRKNGDIYKENPLIINAINKN